MPQRRQGPDGNVAYSWFLVIAGVVMLSYALF
jgi:hypothetical protein